MARRSGGREARKALRSAPLADATKPVHPGEQGGHYKPLTESGIAAINENVFRILEEIGFNDATPHCIEACTAVGAIMGNDGRLRMPRSASMLALPGETLVCCTAGHDGSGLGDAGATVQEFGAHGDVVNVFEVLAALAEREINDVLVEAGPRLAGYLLEKDLIDELVIYQSPHIMGSNTRGMFTTPSWAVLADRRKLDITDTRRVGSDTRITARISG